MITKPKFKEFSKRVIVALTVMWFFGALIGTAVVICQLVKGAYLISIDALLTYIGAPMTGGIVGYMIKSAFENREKIKQNFENFGGDNLP